MPISSFTDDRPVNVATSGGNQLNARVATLRDGGYVVFWQDGFGTTTPIRMQRYDALGDAVGSPANLGVGELTDVTVTANGNVAYATILLNTQTLWVRYLSGSDLSLLGTSSLVPGASLNSAQIETTTGDEVRVIASDTTGVFRAATANISLATMTGVIAIGAGAPGSEVIELGSLNFPTFKYALITDSNFGNSSLLDTGGTGISGGPLTSALDVLTLQPGFQVIMGSAPGSMIPTLTALTGDVGQVAGLTAGSPVSAATISGSGTLLNAAIGSREMVNLGDGRILLVWAAFAGTGTFNGASGLYASVYNVTTGTNEGAATLIRAMPNGALQTLSINGTLLADGRVALSYVAPNGLAGNDVFHSVIDARGDGITVAGNAEANTFVGTSEDDTFTDINFNDRVFGGLGNDTVRLTGNSAREVDLTEVDVQGPIGPRLSNIENLVGSIGSDSLYGSAVANRLDGANGNDLLVGRDGSDTLLGGLGIDTLDGGAEADRIDGGNDPDLLFGGDGNDTVIGGTGDDRGNGGAGDDMLQGGDGNDVLKGGAGNNTLLGGIGDDILFLGDGVNLVSGAEGNDTVHILTSGNLVSGDPGTDTVSYSRFVGSALSQKWIHADLAGTPDVLAGFYGFDDTNDEITTVENLIGSRGDDFLAGSFLGNRLTGGAGNDVLIGRDGADTLTGGGGADVFVFNAANTSSDVIRDYEKDVDRIALVAGTFGDISAENIAARFSSTATATVQANASAQLLFDNAGGGAGRLLFDLDGNGAGSAVLVATLTFGAAGGVGLFSATDFIFV